MSSAARSFLGVISVALAFTCAMAQPTRDIIIAKSNPNATYRYDSATGAELGRFGFFSLGLSFNQDGTVYSGDSRLRLFDRHGAQLWAGDSMSGSPAFWLRGPDGFFYMSDYQVGQVLKVHPGDGTLVSVFVPHLSGGLNKPWGLAFGPDGNLLVSDILNNRILRYNGITGAFIDIFAAQPNLTAIQFITAHPNGRVYVSGGSYEISELDGFTGALLRSIPMGVNEEPKQLALNPDDGLFYTISGSRLTKIDIATGVVTRSAVLYPVQAVYLVAISPWLTSKTPVTNFQIATGRLFSGGLPELTTADDNKMFVRPGATLLSTSPPLSMTFEAVAPNSSPSLISLIVEAGMDELIISSVPIFQIYNFQTGTYSNGLPGLTGFNPGDQRFTFVIAPTEANIGPGNIVRLRCQFKPSNAYLVYPWTLYFDEVSFYFVP